MYRSASALVLLLLLATPLAVFAQSTGKVAGIVTDASGEPLPGANVVIDGTTLGAATNLDGEYTILGVPVGTYDITASFVGYDNATYSDVQVTSGFTRTLDFELSEDAGLGEIVVEYERPLIQNDAIGVPKVVTGEDIENLPVRGVANVAAIQGSVYNREGDDDLNIRGGREEEVVYFVDGVKISGGAAALAVPQQAIAEQEMLIGTIPPRYGDAMAGVISISTKSGAPNFFGSAEFITSEVLDDYGYNLASLAIGGPILPEGRASFFLAGSFTHEADQNPYTIETIRPTDAALEGFRASPQVFLGTDADGNQVQIPFPNGLEPGTHADDVIADPAAFGIEVPEGVTLDGTTLFPATSFVTRDNTAFETIDGKENPDRNWDLNGNLSFRPTDQLSVRIGGAFSDSKGETYSWTNSWFNRDRFFVDEDRSARGYLTLRQNFSGSTFLQVQGEYTQRSGEFYPNAFSSDVEDILFYGDIDHPANAVAARYLSLDDETGDYVQRFADGDLGVSRAYNAFNNPGEAFTNLGGAIYDKYDIDQWRVSGSLQTQLGVHQLEVGGEWEMRTQRRFAAFGGFSEGLARFYNDGDVERGEDNAVTAYDQLDFADAGFLIGTTYYGYNYLGTEEVDGESIAGYNDRSNLDIAPYEPIYYAGYVRDKIEFRDLVIDLGLRIDVFDNNTLVLTDPAALVDLYRVGDFGGGDIVGEDGSVIAAFPGTIPGTIGSDYAIYTNNAGEVVGYRDLDGQFYNAQGGAVDDPTEITTQLGGTPEATGAGINDRVLEEYEAEVTVMPRIGVSFPVTDRALFFASYNVTSQRPSENSLATLQDYAGTNSGQARINNANLRPETTTAYEIGFRQRLGERAALTLTGFYRTQENKITLRNVEAAFPSEYTTFRSEDFTTTKGAEVEFELRRTNNVQFRANYTLSFAEGTGSDSNTATIIAWRGNLFPNTLDPLAFDQRHTINTSLDYRLGEGEGPMLGGVHVLEGFGFNLLGQFGSGTPYTQLDDDGFTTLIVATNGGAEGEINSVYTDWTTRLDLRVDRDFNLGPASLKAYVWVQNLLDTDNVFGVYRTTGLAGDDGFLSSANGQQELNQVGSDLEREAYRFLYSSYVDAPVQLSTFKTSNAGQIYGLPRRVRLGLLFSF